MLAYMLSLFFMFLLAQFFSYHWASPHVVEWCVEMWPVLMLTNNWRWDPVLLPTATNNPNSSGGHQCWLPECAAHITTDDAWHWLDAVCCNPSPTLSWCRQGAVTSHFPTIQSTILFQVCKIESVSSNASLYSSPTWCRWVLISQYKT